MKKQRQDATKPSKTFARRFLALQREVFRGERRKQAALAELRRIAGASFAASVESLAESPRVDCGECGESLQAEEIGESGMCADCAEGAAIARLEE